MTDEGSCTGLGGGVRQWNGFRPPGEAINDREEVLHALGFIEGPHQVYMEAAEATVRGWPLGERCLNMAVGLRCLAGVTFSAPLTDVPFQSMPHEACGDGVLRWAAAGMGKAVNGIEDPPCPLPRNHWTRFTHGDIAEDCAADKLDIVEAEASNGGFVGSDFLRDGLVSGQLAKVNGRKRDSRDAGSGECISDHIVFSTDMKHIGGKLTDKRQVTCLAG